MANIFPNGLTPNPVLKKLIGCRKHSEYPRETEQVIQPGLFFTLNPFNYPASNSFKLCKLKKSTASDGSEISIESKLTTGVVRHQKEEV
uniref:Uncharacterized protein n=1 Tax=Romanomermis culicivorax TaxID=13658 RepID=A0A915ILJ5_ROMCU